MQAKNPKSFHINLLAILCLSVLALAGCGKDYTNDPYNEQTLKVDPPQGSTLLTANTYAADALGSMLKKRVSPTNSIVVTSMVDIEDLDKSSRFGMVTMQQISSRLGQQGFKVLEVRLSSEMKMEVRKGEFMLTRDAEQLIAKEYDAHSALVGVYSDKGDMVYVSVRAVRISDSAILAAYDYYLPKQGDTYNMLDNSSAGNVDTWSRYSKRDKTE